MRSYKKRKNDDENTFALSISDLMMGMMVIFMLLFINQNAQYLNNKGLERKVSAIDKITENVNNKLEASFKNVPFAKIDREKQELVLSDKVLFELGKFKLNENGKEALRKVIPLFFKTIIDDPSIVNWIEQLTIEGHTDDIGSYLDNLKLSQDRSYEVSNFIYNDEEITKMLGVDRQKKLQILLSSNGKSNAMLIKNDQNKVDREASRRVTIKYRLDYEKILNMSEEELRKVESEDKNGN